MTISMWSCILLFFLQGLSSLGKYNNHLRDVTLSECADITDLGLQKFTQQCKDIERLDLSHCKVPLPCTTNCEKSNENLKKMILSTYTWCGCQVCEDKHLSTLTLLYFQLLTDGAIKNLAFCCRYLTSLNLAGCKLVSSWL